MRIETSSVLAACPEAGRSRIVPSLLPSPPMTRRGRERIDDRWQATSRRDARRRGNGLRVGPLTVTPLRVAMAVALLGSLAYVAFAITVRDASAIPMLSSGAAVLGIVFLALAVAGAASIKRAGDDGRNALAFAYALVGGGAAIIACGCFAAAVVLALLLQQQP